jgi:LPS export ABC transporter permease LptG
MKILTRYILKEMIGPTLLGFGFYTFIILMRQLFALAGMIIQRSLPVATVGKLLLLSLPNIVVLTVPMSLLFGILIAVGRLSADSEIIALRALGISTRVIYKPVFIFSFAVFLLNLYLMNVVLPKGNTEFVSLRAELATSGAQREIKPRLFYDEYENLVVYVNDVDPQSGQWKGVFVADNRAEEAQTGNSPQAAIDSAHATDNSVSGPFNQKSAQQRVVVAITGDVTTVQPSKQIWMNLRDAETHLYDPKKPERYDLNRNATQRILMSESVAGEPALSKSLREMNLRELSEQVRRSRYKDRETYRMARIEIHKKFAIPFACIVFGILGLPLGITNRRGGRSSGFSLSIAIILGYYLMINNFEKLAGAGKLGPAFAMWAPNVILLAIGIYLLGRANRDAGSQGSERSLMQRLGSVLGRIVPRRKNAGNVVHDTDESSSILSRLDITFPNILDRYVLREFSKVLGLVLISTVALFIIIDYTELSSDISQHKIPLSTIIAYYRFLIFQVLNLTLPISVLVATLVTFGMLSKNNEVTAFKSGGVSLYRVALPIVVIATLISVLSYLMLDFVLPYSNQRVDDLHNQIKGRPATSSTVQQKLWFVGKGRYLINFLSYDREKKELSQVQVFELADRDFRLTRRVYAQSAQFDGTGWVFRNGWMRSFDRNGNSSYTPIREPVRLYYPERPTDFETEVKSPEQMTYRQLNRYIETLRRSGYSAEELTVKLYTKTSWPFISLVMALIALPFAFRIGKRGALYGVGLALLLGILYWMIFAIFTKFGEVGNLPAVLSAWSANILFALAAIYMFLHVET